MRQIANLFLALYLVTASLNLLKEFLAPYWSQNPLLSLPHLAGSFLFILAVLVYSGLGLNRHLAKSIFVPLLAYLLWGLLDFWPLESVAGGHLLLIGAVGQLLLGLLAMDSIRRHNGGSPFLTPDQFEGPGFSAGNFLRFCLVSIPLLPLLLLLIGFSVTSNLIEEYTAGFIRLKPNGLYMVEKVYAQGEKEIRLAGMIHMGREGYYEELSDSFRTGHSLLLAEGVTDKKGLLTRQFNYGKVAGLLGLVSQEQQLFAGRLIDAASLDYPLSDAIGEPDILRADIDLQDFDPQTIKVLNAIGTYLLNNSSLSLGYQEFNRWAEQNITAEVSQILMADLVLKRNLNLLSFLPKGLKKYQTILIPWGALHMPGIEEAVKARGFSLRDSRERLSIDFFSLSYAGLWDNFAGTAGE
jgi:hypothetical protein